MPALGDESFFLDPGESTEIFSLVKLIGSLYGFPFILCSAGHGMDSKSLIFNLLSLQWGGQVALFFSKARKGHPFDPYISIHINMYRVSLPVMGWSMDGEELKILWALCLCPRPKGREGV